MKSSIWCAFMIAMLFVAPVASGAIMEIGDFDSSSHYPGDVSGDWEASDADCHVDGDESYGWAQGDGWISVYPTEYGEYDWAYSISAYAGVAILLRDFNRCYTHASAYAHADCPHGQHTADAEVVLYDTDYQGRRYFFDSDEEGWWNDGTDYFDPAQGVYGVHEVSVNSTVKEGYDDEAWSDAQASAYCSMSGEP